MMRTLGITLLCFLALTGCRRNQTQSSRMEHSREPKEASDLPHRFELPARYETPNLVKLASADSGFEFEFNPINRKFFQKGVRVALGDLEAILRKRNYATRVDVTFNLVTTSPRYLDYLTWLSEKERWEVTCSFIVELRTASDDNLYWRLLYRITGKRSGEQERLFSPDDFETTQKMHEELVRDLTNYFNGSQ